MKTQWFTAVFLSITENTSLVLGKSLQYSLTMAQMEGELHDAHLMVSWLSSCLHILLLGFHLIWPFGNKFWNSFHLSHYQQIKNPKPCFPHINLLYCVHFGSFHVKESWHKAFQQLYCVIPIKMNCKIQMLFIQELSMYQDFHWSFAQQLAVSKRAPRWAGFVRMCSSSLYFRNYRCQRVSHQYAFGISSFSLIMQMYMKGNDSRFYRGIQDSEQRDKSRY